MLAQEPNPPFRQPQYAIDGNWLATAAINMRDPGIRHNEHIPTSLNETIAPVNFLRIHEIRFVQQPDSVNCGPARQESGTHNSVNTPW